MLSGAIIIIIIIIILNAHIGTDNTSQFRVKIGFSRFEIVIILSWLCALNDVGKHKGIFSFDSDLICARRKTKTKTKTSSASKTNVFQYHPWYQWLITLAWGKLVHCERSRTVLSVRNL